MRSIRQGWLIGLLGLAAGVASAAPVGDGLKLAEEQAPWGRWQARLSVISPSWLGSAGSAGSPAPWSLGAARLSGDRYFNLGHVGDGGGLRASSALMLGSRALVLGALPAQALEGPVSRGAWPGEAGSADWAASTYVGLGYSAWWLRSGLGLSADVGLMAQRSGSTLSGGSNLDNTVRAMQLSPVLQVNLSFSF